MKKWIHRIAAIVVLVANFSLPGFTQTDAAAKSLLDKVSQTYQAFKTIQADFTLEIKQAQQASHTESGVIYMNKAAGKYHISTPSQDIISDGRTQWMVLKDVEEVQITDVDRSSETISPINIFTFYETGYKYVSAADERAGNRQLAVVELTPEDTRTPYFKIKLRIDQQTHQIHDVTIFDKGGNRFVYTIKDARTNALLADNKFTFSPANYPGIEIVDLR